METKLSARTDLVFVETSRTVLGFIEKLGGNASQVVVYVMVVSDCHQAIQQSPATSKFLWIGIFAAAQLRSKCGVT